MGMASKHRVTVGEELRYDSDLQGLKNLSGTYATRAGGTTPTVAPLPFVNVRDFGAKGDGTTDDSAAFAAALTAAALGGLDLAIPGGIYKIPTAQTWNAYKHSIRGFGNVFLDFGTCTSGPALTVTGAAGGSGYSVSLTGTQHEMESLTLLGPDTDATTVDGIYFADSSAVSMVTTRKVRVTGFRDNLSFGSNTWLTKFYDCTFSKAHRRGINLTPGTNAGENVSFFGCLVNNCHAATNDAVGVYSSGNPDAYFHGCSFDYNDIEFNHTGGKITVHGGHIENGRSDYGSYAGNPMVKLKWVSGGNRTMMTLVGVEVSPTEGTNGNSRDHLVENTSDSGDHVYLTCVGVVWDTYDTNATIFKNLAAGAQPVFRNLGGMWDNKSVAGDKSASVGQYTNLLYNGDFDTSGSFLGSSSAPFYPGRDWSKDGGGAPAATFAFDTTNQRSGARCVNINGPTGNANAQSLKTAFAVTPGAMIQFSGWVKIDTYTSGNLTMRLSWYLDDYTTRTVVAFQQALTAVQGWKPIVGRLIVPPGIRVALLDFQSNSFVGNAYVDDVVVNTNQ